MMALIDHSSRGHDLSIIGLVIVVFGILAASASCLKIAMDQLFSLF
jgi:hypothetical protein